MAVINSNYDKLAAGYLFPEIERRTRRYVSANPNVRLLKLGIGNTTEPLPPSVIEGLRSGVEKLSRIETYTGYGEAEGDVRLRQALIDYYARRDVRFGLDECFISDGAKPDSGNIQSIFGLENIVAVQDPVYPVYVDTNVIAGRTGSFDKNSGRYQKIVYMPCTAENGFFPDLPNRKADLIYLCSPNNPTGAVATHEQLKRFVDWAKENQSIIFFDAAYSSYIRDPELPRSIYEIEGAESCAIEFSSFSKFAGFTGVRLGWMIVPKALTAVDALPGKINGLWARRQCTFFNGASNIAQEGGIAALSERGLAECQSVIDFYLENARIIHEGLKRKGLVSFGGENAPYLWVRTPNEMPSWDFFDKLLNEAHVVVTPGAGFGPSGEGYVRISAFGHRQDIEAAVASIENNLKIG
jgi:LL-diaminopimelate aminotransferase